MLASRTFRVVFVSPAHGAGLDTNSTPDAVVSYTGNAVVITRSAPNIPSAPTGLIANSGSNGVALSWTGSTEGTVYHLQRSLQSGGSYATIAYPVFGTSYLDTEVEAGATYYYVVSAINVSGEGGASVAVATTIPGSSLRTLLMFNEVSGTTAADDSGHGWHTTLINGPARVVGKGGNAVDFGGTNQYASLPAGVVNGLNNCTIAAWVNLDAATQNSRVFDFGSGTNTYMYLTPKGQSNVATFAVTTSGTSGEQQINGSTALPTGSWTHVAVTLSGSVGIFYVNGVEVGRNSGMSIQPWQLGSSTQNWIGRSQFDAHPYLDGRVDDFRIYSGALSVADIQALAGGSASALLSPWTGQDIGSPTIPGSSGCGVSGSNSLHVTASGTDIWSTSDQFRFVWVARSGTTDFIARIDAMDASDPWAKAGLMVRSGTGAGDVNCLLAVTPQNGVTFQSRSSSGGSTSNSQVTGFTAPRWLKISRAGSTFTAYHSADGVIWSQVGSSVTLSAMPATACYGIALTAHTNAAPVGAAFSSISVQDPPPPIPVTASLTAPATDLDDRYFFASGLNDVDNIGGSGITSSSQNDEDTYVSADRSSKGQTFTTGSNYYGYTIRSFTFQHVLWPQYLSNGSFYNVQPNDTFAFEFGVMSGTTKTPIYAGYAKYSGTALVGSGNNGSGNFFTFDLTSLSLPTLSGNTTYYFEIAPATGDPYLELNGSRTGNYSGGTAFRGSDAGIIGTGVNVLTGDRIFHADLARIAPPSYATWIALYPGVGTLNGPNDDPDGDGITNMQEYVAGTNPADWNSALKPSVLQPVGNDMILEFQSVLGRTYRVEYSDTLQSGSWVTLQDNIAGTGGTVQVADLGGASQPKRFYRMVVQLQ